MDFAQFLGRFHVLILHLPIGILLMASAMEFYCAVTATKRNLTLSVVWIWGAISAIVAACLGFLLSLNGGYNPDAVEVHRFWGISLAAFAMVCAWVFKSDRLNPKSVMIGLSAIQIIFLTVTGHYGANLTHGPTFLVEYAPNSIRTLAGFPPRAAARPVVVSLDMAHPWLDVIEPILSENCAGCHNSSKMKGGLNMESYASLIEGGESGATIVANNPDASEVYKRITLMDTHEDFMPAEGKPPLNTEQMASIKWWISAGAPNSGSVQEFAQEEDLELLNMVLGLSGSASDLGLPEVAALKADDITALEKAGFVVKIIAEELNYLDVDYSVSQSALTEEAYKALLAVKDRVVSLNLSNSNITAEQVGGLSQFENLIRLRLEKNNITSQTVAPLAILSRLSYLNLYQTSVDDKFLSILPNFKALKNIYLWQTQITPEALAEYKTDKLNLYFGHPSNEPI